MRHVFISWRKALTALHDSKLQKTRALAFSIIKSYSKGFESLRTYRQRKIQKEEKQILAEKWWQKTQVHRAFGILQEYKDKRVGIMALREIGDEMRSIREAQTTEKILMAWYEAMCVRVRNGGRMEKVADGYA